MLVYISCCLAGHAYPSGHIADDDVVRVKEDVLNCITALHTSQPSNTEPAYPHLRTLLSFDTREFFNVLSLAFDDTADMTRDKKQRIVDILLLLMVDGVGFSPAQVCSATILESHLPRYTVELRDSHLEWPDVHRTGLLNSGTCT